MSGNGLPEPGSLPAILVDASADFFQAEVFECEPDLQGAEAARLLDAEVAEPGLAAHESAGAALQISRPSGKRRPVQSAVTHQEFLASQVEHASPVFTDLGEAGTALVAFRREVDRDAARHAVSVASIGTTPDAHAFPSITDNDRYHRIVRDMAGVIRPRVLSMTASSCNHCNRSSELI